MMGPKMTLTELQRLGDMWMRAWENLPDAQREQIATVIDREGGFQSLIEFTTAGDIVVSWAGVELLRVKRAALAARLN